MAAGQPASYSMGTTAYCPGLYRPKNEVQEAHTVPTQQMRGAIPSFAYMSLCNDG